MTRNRLIVLAAVAAVAVGAVLCKIFIDYSRATEKTTVDLYYINEDGTGIVSSPCKIRYKNDDDLIRTTLDKLRKGPNSAMLGRIMPKKTEIYGADFSGGGSLTVRFSKDFVSNDTSRNVLSVYAVVKSLCSTARVSTVKVLAGDEPIKDRDGKTLEFISASDINLESEEYRSEMREVELYFSDSDGKTLVPEKRTIKITDQQPIEQYIINELINGPNNKKSKPLLSEKTVLVSVDVEENICYLNFKSDFLKINQGTEEYEKLVIYSIVNSLTELQTISRVQFYMDGKRVENFGSVRIDNYIGRNTSIIKTEGESKE